MRDKGGGSISEDAVPVGFKGCTEASRRPSATLAVKCAAPESQMDSRLEGQKFQNVGWTSGRTMDEAGLTFRARTISPGGRKTTSTSRIECKSLTKRSVLGVFDGNLRGPLSLQYEPAVLGFIQV